MPGERFEDAIASVKRAEGVETDAELSVEALKELVERFKGFYEFPQDAQEQLGHAIRAVFESWTGERAVSYRRINRIPDDWGTAVNVQQMVFGNKGETSATGVAFSRDEVTGAPEPSGDFLVNAQGEDVVSGVRTPLDIRELADVMPEADAQLMRDPAHARVPLQEHAGHRVHDRGGAPVDAPDAERQAAGAGGGAVRGRRGVRGAADAGRGAADDRRRMARRPAASDVRHAARATTCWRAGVAASPGAAAGEIVFTAPEAVAAAAAGKDVILVRPFTAADDVAGFHAAKGILTSEGGKASHAALVARGMGVPAVTGAAVAVDLEAQQLHDQRPRVRGRRSDRDRRQRRRGRRARARG